jgi:hypothetical protein
MELQELIEDDQLLLEMLQTLPALKSFDAKREALSEQCVFLARTFCSLSLCLHDTSTW